MVYYGSVWIFYKGVLLLRHSYKYLLSARLLIQVVLLTTRLSAVHVARQSQLVGKPRLAHLWRR